MKRKFGSIIDCGNGKYRCRWSDVHGRKRSHYVHGTYHDAELYLAKKEMQMFGCDESVTYADYWETTVLPQIETLEAKTQHEYLRTWRKHLEPSIGSRIVASTNYRFAQSVIDEVEAPYEQRRTAVLWKKICNMAIRDGIMQVNPIQRMQYKKLVKREKVILDREQILPYIRSILSSSYAHLVILEMCAGLRHEEATAVTSEDVEYTEGNAIISVNKARVCVNGVMVEKDTKNAISVRSVPLCGVFAQMLHDCEIVPRNPQTATHNWRSWCKRNGIPYVPFGDMRSIFATVAGECCDGGLVDIYMGHSGRSTMDRWYRSSTEKGMLIVAESFEKYTHKLDPT